jgi:uncharacterized protein
MKEELLHKWEQKTMLKQKSYKQMLDKINVPKTLKMLPTWHEDAFENVDCLACANCCKNYSPRFKPPDIKRIAKALKMNEAAFIEKYLRRDDDGDYVVTTKPCPFLGSDNFCSIYEERPSDCRRFPYTDEDVLLKKKQITLKNSTFCPAVYWVLEKMQAQM